MSKSLRARRDVNYNAYLGGTGTPAWLKVRFFCRFALLARQSSVLLRLQNRQLC